MKSESQNKLMCFRVLRSVSKRAASLKREAVTRTTQRSSVTDSISNVFEKRPWLDMVSVKFSPLLTAQLACKFVALKHSLAPRFVFASSQHCFSRFSNSAFPITVVCALLGFQRAFRATCGKFPRFGWSHFKNLAAHLARFEHLLFHRFEAACSRAKLDGCKSAFLDGEYLATLGTRYFESQHAVCHINANSIIL